METIHTTLLIRQADNGMLIEDRENSSVEVYEDTHTTGSTSKDNIIRRLGQHFYEEVQYAMDKLVCNNIQIKLEITKQDSHE